MRAEEATFFAHVSFSGGLQESLGPYKLINLIGNGERELKESLALRYTLHLPEQAQPHEVPEKPQVDSSLGLSLDEEIAALLSMFLSIRLRSGGVSRQFTVESNDPAGLPVVYGRVRPTLEFAKRPVIPRLHHPQAFLGSVPGWLGKLPSLTAGQSVALVRAARQYQMAVWVADSDPELAWLQLVSAVEVAATQWRGAKVDAIDILNEVYPEIVAKLENSELSSFVARRLQKLVGSTRRFLDFMAEFDPGPPDQRCEEHFQIPWSDLRRRLNLVYGYRSSRLHSGVPFPPVMNQPPMVLMEGVPPIERPFGVAHFVGSTQWPANAVPMHLWFFERLVQGALVRWYEESLGAAS